jgi:hypothetical protein
LSAVPKRQLPSAAQAEFVANWLFAAKTAPFNERTSGLCFGFWFCIRARL